MLINVINQTVSMVKLEKILKLRLKKCGINLFLKIKTSSLSSSIELFFELLYEYGL